jgi:Kef-type K+ transport system membrane component KefB
VIFIAFIVRPIFKGIAKKIKYYESPPQIAVLLIILTLFVVAFISEIIGSILFSIPFSFDE